MKVKIKFLTNLKKSFLLTILIFGVSRGADVFAAPTSLSSPKLPATRKAVALSKSVAQMWLLAGGEISATTDDGLELEDAKNAVSVGGLTTASLEAILSVNPELVLMTLDIPLHKKIHASLRDFGIKTYIADVKSFSDYEKVMADFTALTGRKDLYDKNVVQVKKTIEEIVKKAGAPADAANSETSATSAVPTSPATPSTYLFLRVSSAKNKVLKDHFGNEIFQAFGLKSIISDDSPLDEIGVEAIVNADPDYIFVVAQGDQKRADEAFYKAYKSNPAWAGLTAVKNDRVFMLPKELFNYKPNARWAEAYEIVGNLIK